MRTIGELVSLYLSSVNYISGDADLDKRLIKSWIRTSRAIWVKNELQKNKPVSTIFIQPLGVLDLEIADRSEVPISGFNILRSKKTIPETIENFGEPSITRISPALVTSASYRFIAFERVPFIGSGRFDENAIFTFLHPTNNQIYIISKGTNILKNAMRKIIVNAILANPEDASTYSNIDRTPCYTSSSAYPISEYLVGYMKDIIINVDFKTFMAAHPDEFNNAKDDYRLSAAGMPRPQKQTQPNQEEE